MANFHSNDVRWRLRARRSLRVLADHRGLKFDRPDLGEDGTDA
jgi:hypothetical protein